MRRGKTVKPAGNISRREFLIDAAVVGAAILLPGESFAAADGKKTFTILHTNDMHSNFIGMGPASDYTPFRDSIQQAQTEKKERVEE